MSEELPDEHQPTSLRKEATPRTKVGYAYGTRDGEGVKTTWSPRKGDVLLKLLEHVPSPLDFDKGMPVIVRLNKDGSEEVLYVWHISRNLWIRDKG